MRNDAEREGRYLVFFHTMQEGRVKENRGVVVRALPHVGEFVTFTFNGAWFLVTRVLHCTVENEDREFDAEVWIKEVDHLNLPDKASL